MNKGFTLIELLIVVAIIGILAAVGAVMIPNILGKTKEQACVTNYREFVNFAEIQFYQCTLKGQTASLSLQYSITSGGQYTKIKCNKSIAFLGQAFADHYTNVAKDSYNPSEPWEYSIKHSGDPSKNGETYITWPGNDKKFVIKTMCGDNVLFDTVIRE